MSCTCVSCSVVYVLRSPPPPPCDSPFDPEIRAWQGVGMLQCWPKSWTSFLPPCPLVAAQKCRFWKDLAQIFRRIVEIPILVWENVGSFYNLGIVDTELISEIDVPEFCRAVLTNSYWWAESSGRATLDAVCPNLWYVACT
eukprot:gene16800-biopygen14356